MDDMKHFVRESTEEIRYTFTFVYIMSWFLIFILGSFILKVQIIFKTMMTTIIRSESFKKTERPKIERVNTVKWKKDKSDHKKQSKKEKGLIQKIMKPYLILIYIKCIHLCHVAKPSNRQTK